MKRWPEFNSDGDLPLGVHPASLEDVCNHFGTTARRLLILDRLVRIYRMAQSTGHLARFVVFGSFITAKPEPRDIDIFLLMEDSFEVKNISSEAKLVFDRSAAQNFLGASVFWIRKSSAMERGAE